MKKKKNVLRVSAIVPAAGCGIRVRRKASCKEPKQFWPLASSTVLGTILAELERSCYIKEIILACAPQYRSFCEREIIRKHNLKKIKKIVAGGKERAHSVARCLQQVAPSCSHILVQDGVRPFVTASMIEGLVRGVGAADGIIVARPVAPTLKRVRKNRITGTVDRTTLWEAETPQLFKRSVLTKAFQRFKKHLGEFTDEAALIEAVGGTVKVFTPDDINIKITNIADYRLAKKMIGKGMVRVGIGYDIHRLIEGRKLILGGVKIPYSKGCLGHSDGDPVLHAIADALLGALALGDIGDHFPDTDPKIKNMDSTDIVRRIMAMVTRLDFTVAHIDATVIAEKPKLQKYKMAMRNHIARLLRIEASQVSVKAKTKEGLDSEGSGFAISVFAVVSLEQR